MVADQVNKVLIFNSGDFGNLGNSGNPHKLLAPRPFQR